jgi:hypothetical protein
MHCTLLVLTVSVRSNGSVIFLVALFSHFFVWLRRKLQHPHHGDFAGCTSPTGLLDSRDPFDLQQPQIGE